MTKTFNTVLPEREYALITKFSPFHKSIVDHINLYNPNATYHNFIEHIAFEFTILFVSNPVKNPFENDKDSLNEAYLAWEKGVSQGKQPVPAGSYTQSNESTTANKVTETRAVTDHPF